MSGYLPDDVTQAMIDRHLDAGAENTRCPRCRQDLDEHCGVCGTCPTEGHDFDCERDKEVGRCSCGAIFYTMDAAHDHECPLESNESEDANGN